MPIVNQAQKHVWKVAKVATNFFDVYIPTGCVYKTFPARTIKGKHFPAMCVYSTDFEGMKKRNHAIVTRIVDGIRMRPEYVDITKGCYNGMKQFAMSIENPQVKQYIPNRDIRPIAPKDRKVCPYIQRGVRSRESCFETDLVTNHCKVGMRTYSNEMYEHERMGVK